VFGSLTWRLSRTGPAKDPKLLPGDQGRPSGKPSEDGHVPPALSRLALFALGTPQVLVGIG